MLLLERKAKLKWNPANKKRYVDLGYIFTGWGEEFLVEIEHLTPTTRALVFIECDFCESIKEIDYKSYFSTLKRSETKKVTCGNIDCVQMKTIESNLSIYGFKSHNSSPEVQLKKIETVKENYGEEYTSPSQVQEVKEKIKKTNIKKYGVENVFQSEDIKRKIVETNNEKYGVDYYTQTDEHKERIKETNLNKYGVEFASQADIVKDKTKETNFKRYGVPIPTQNPFIIKKGMETNIKRYGVPNYTQTEEYLIKTKSTNLKKYGVEYHSQSDIVKNKVRKTNIERYGYSNPMKNPEIIKKVVESRFQNGTAPISKQQLYIGKLFNGELNKPLQTYHLDIVIDDIVIEYDGGGHDLQVKLGNITEKEFIKKEIIRNTYIKKNGYNLITIVSRKDILPKDNVLLDMIANAKTIFEQGRRWVTYDIDDSIIKYKDFTDKYHFGDLRKIA